MNKSYENVTSFDGAYKAMLSKMTAYSASAAKMNMIHEISHVDIAVNPT